METCSASGSEEVGFVLGAVSSTLLSGSLLDFFLSFSTSRAPHLLASVVVASVVAAVAAAPVLAVHDDSVLAPVNGQPMQHLDGPEVRGVRNARRRFWRRRRLRTVSSRRRRRRRRWRLYEGGFDRRRWCRLRQQPRLRPAGWERYCTTRSGRLSARRHWRRSSLGRLHP